MTGRTADDGPIQGFARLARITGEAAAPTTLIVALMVYFGWACTSVQYAVLGIDRGTLGLSVQDYLFRSVNETFRPLECSCSRCWWRSQDTPRWSDP